MGSRRRLLLALVCTSLALAGSSSSHGQEIRFQRGDTNIDGSTDLSDGVRTLRFLFIGGLTLECADAADANDTGGVDLSDATYTFNYLFTGGAMPPAPHPDCGVDPTPDGLDCASFEVCPQQPPPSELRDVGHVLNRVAYGPSPSSIADVESLGIEEYLNEQLDPDSIDESGNTALLSREAELFETRQPSIDTPIVRAGEIWRYRKGTSQPSLAWKNRGFDDSGEDWLLGPTGIGYGDGDDVTYLADMRRLSDDPDTPEVNESQPGYLSVYLRKTFNVADVDAIDNLFLRIDFDDGFVCYINGVEVARSGLSGNPPLFNAASSSHEAGEPVEFDITPRRTVLDNGENVIAIQVHNTDYTSSDLTMIPELVSREFLPGPSITTIRGASELQHLAHVRGVYSQRQLQTVMAEFWENHFTTDLDKVAEYFDSLQNSDATDAMSGDQARLEAAQAEYQEYQFLYDNALGDFGDLLLYSATSPTMLIYLDNILNFKDEPNENYAREILELSAFGVDNRYTQRDLEVLARCFTGWTVCKILPQDLPVFPEGVRSPPVACGVEYEDSTFIGLGAGWKYFKGTEEPTPATDGDPTTAWAEADYDDSAWLSGSTGIGYGDGDDATVLSDMRNNYLTVYMRREFIVDDPFEFENLILQVDYDDGFVAYLNGQEIGRSETMEDEGSPPAYDDNADDTHEVDEGTELFNLNRFLAFLRPAPQTNVLAIQVHNASEGSSDLSMLPRLIDRNILPGSVENGDSNGVWHFRFDASEHDTGSKVLFPNTPYQINVPAGRVGAAGVQDALQVIDEMVNHPSTREFICIKLIQKFVSDEISLATFKGDPQSIPIELRGLLADCTVEWQRTNGNIGAVMRVILDPERQESAFWSDLAYRSKVKTPIEFINSSLRVLEGDIDSDNVPDLNEDFGMFLFTRDEPDGWPEDGVDFNGTATALERTNFVNAFARDDTGLASWNATSYVAGLNTAEEIVDALVDVMFQGQTPASSRDILLEYLTTNINGSPLPFSRGRADFQRRVQELVGLMLSMPEWQFQ